MKYILWQNTTYKKLPLFEIESLEEWNSYGSNEVPWLKPILISTNEKTLKQVQKDLKGALKK